MRTYCTVWYARVRTVSNSYPPLHVLPQVVFFCQGRTDLNRFRKFETRVKSTPRPLPPRPLPPYTHTHPVSHKSNKRYQCDHLRFGLDTHHRHLCQIMSINIFNDVDENLNWFFVCPEMMSCVPIIRYLLRQSVETRRKGYLPNR